MASPADLTLAVAPLTDVGDWARSTLLEVILLITGAVLVTRFATWVSGRLTARLDARAEATDTIARSESLKHGHAVVQVVTWSLLVLTYCVTAVMVLRRLGVPLSGFVAPATVAGVALGFGAQRVVQDILAGFFVVTERQYGFGDVIRLAVLGAGAPVTGTVEDVTLRVTRIRTLNGEVVTTPNGQIVQVTNLSRDWARAVVDVPVPIKVDLARATDILHEVCAALYTDEHSRALLLDRPSVMGVESLDVDQFNVRVVARTLPGRQFDVGRELRSRITAAFLRAGISVPTTLDTAEPTKVDA